MTEEIRKYLLSVIAAALLSSLVLSLIPNGTIQKVIRMGCGLLLTICLLSPLLRLDASNMASYFSELQILSDEAAFDISLQNEEVVRDIIKQKAETYIWDKAKSLGIELQRVEVTIHHDKITPYPESVRITGFCREAEKTMLARFIEDNLAIPNAQQEYIWTARDENSN